MSDARKELLSGPQRNIGIHFGALSPSIWEQLSEQGLTADEKDLKHWDRDAEAITRLFIRGLLTPAQKDGAQKKLFNKIKRGVWALDANRRKCD